MKRKKHDRPSLQRCSGILLHPTSLPAPYGLGDLGTTAYDFVDWLVSAGQTIWQVLPLGPTGYADSPYQSFSVFGGNPLLISLDMLLEDGLLEPRMLAPARRFPARRADYGRLTQHRPRVLKEAWKCFAADATSQQKAAVRAFRRQHAVWLPEFALYMALKDRYRMRSWRSWPPAVRMHNQAALDRLRPRLQDQIDAHSFFQYLFFTQWQQLRKYAREQGLVIIGDTPLYVAPDSADVWANRSCFQLDRKARPIRVAGVPPDYYSPTGQLWGNPVYNWKRMQRDGFSWWISRLRTNLELCDYVRFDHFRGLAGFWAVPFGKPTAQYGKWYPAPGQAFLRTVRRKLGGMPILAEDLGVITPDVIKLLNDFELPGMKVLQFAFESDAGSHFLPHNYTDNYVVYTGTHDNDTSRGWYSSASAATRRRVRAYLNSQGTDISWDMLRAAWSSVARAAVAPLQDVLSLGNKARMNTPSTASGNWCWRVKEEELDDKLAARLHKLTATYGRLTR